MENYLIVIIIIGSLAYQMYSNYKKEMDKAKQRAQQQKKVQHKQEFVMPTTPKKVEQRKSTFESIDVPEEVARIHEQKRIDKNKSLNQEIPKEELDNIPSFDLRDAVIKAAILERPYK
jgi:hemolysin activation/secretion protein